MLRVFLVILFSQFSFQVNAQTWQELNKKSVELFEAGKEKKAAEIAVEAIEIYKTSQNYTPENHAKLAVMAAGFYEERKRYKKAGELLEETIKFIADLYPQGHLELINLWKNRAEFRILDRRRRLSKGDRIEAIKAARKIFGERTEKIALEWIELVKWGENIASEAEQLEYLKIASEIYSEIYPKTNYENYKKKINLINSYRSVISKYWKARKTGKIDDLLIKLAEKFPSTTEFHIPVMFVAPKITDRRLKNTGISKVLFKFSISKKGRPINIEVLESSGKKLFIDVAISGLKKARFIPGYENGQLLQVNNIKTTFTLTNKGNGPRVRIDSH